MQEMRAVILGYRWGGYKNVSLDLEGSILVPLYLRGAIKVIAFFQNTPHPTPTINNDWPLTKFSCTKVISLLGALSAMLLIFCKFFDIR